MSIKNKLDYIAVFGIVFLAIGSAFLIGRMSAEDSGKLPISIRSSAALSLEGENKEGINQEEPAGSEQELPRYGLYAASANSKIFHFWKCPSASRVKDENLLWFDTAEEAEAEGKSPAADCKEEIEKAIEKEKGF